MIFVIIFVENAHFFVATFENFLDANCPVALDAKCDIVISNFALHLSPCRATAFANIFTALKPGGEFHAMYPTHCSFLSRALNELEQHDEWGPLLSKKPIHEKNPNGVLLGNEDTEQYPTHTIATFKLLLAAGFPLSSIRVSDRVFITEFESEDEIVKFFAGINLHRELIPEDQREEFDKQCAFEMRRTPYFTGKNRMTLLAPVMEIHAYKEDLRKVESSESFVE